MSDAMFPRPRQLMAHRAGEHRDRADPGRIEQFITEIGEVGRDPRGGWSRLAFSPEERQAHHVFSRWGKDLGLNVLTDAIGNTYADLPGKRAQPVLMVGSHLDSVFQGGNYDGVAGIAAALEAARILGGEGQLSHGLRLVVFVAEEGARFGAPCIGSRIATGSFSAETLRNLTDKFGKTAAQYARDLGLRPGSADEAAWQENLVGAFLELHIEQGSVLETRARQIGIVDVIAGSTRLQLSIQGCADHSGATPMALRHDALAGAAEFILDVERQASAHLATVATVGTIDIDPGSLTTVPGNATIGLDVRDVDSDRQRDLTELLIDEALRIAARRKLQVSAELLSDQSPVLLHKPVRERLVRAASEMHISFCVMPSGAGHDAAHVARIAPTGLVFVPSKGGVSHAPDEWSDATVIASAANVMAAVLKGLDAEGPWAMSRPPPEVPDI